MTVLCTGGWVEGRRAWSAAWPEFLQRALHCSHAAQRCTRPQARFSLCSLCDLFLFNSGYSGGSSKHVSGHGGAEVNRLLEFHHRVCHFMTKIGIGPLENSAIGTALPKRALGSNSFPWQWFLLRKVQVDSCYFHKSSCLQNVIWDIPFLTQAMDPASCLMLVLKQAAPFGRPGEATCGSQVSILLSVSRVQDCPHLPFLAYNWFSTCCDLVPTVT